MPLALLLYSPSTFREQLPTFITTGPVTAVTPETFPQLRYAVMKTVSTEDAHDVRSL